MCDHLYRLDSQIGIRRRYRSSHLDPKGFGVLYDAPGRREAAAGHRLGMGKYGFHWSGVTASGVPLLALTQPATVSLNGDLSAYVVPRPSLTISVTSWSNGAASSGFQPNLSMSTSHFYHRPSRARRIAGLSGFLTLIQSRDGPER
jgi:hypothetical protein